MVARATIPIVAFVVLSLSFPGLIARADTSSQLRTAQAKLDEITGRIRAAAGQRDALQAQLTTLFGQVDANRQALEGAQVQVKATQDQISTLTAQIGEQQSALDQRAAEVYAEGPVSGLVVILGATSASDLQDRLELANAAAQSDSDLITGLAERKNTLHVRQDELQRLQERLQGAQTQLQSAVAGLNAKFAAQQAAVGQLSRDQAAAQSLVASLTDQRQKELAQQQIRSSGGGGAGGSAGGGGGGGGSPSPSPSPKPHPSPPKPPPPPPPPPPPGGGSVQNMIVSYFTPLGTANVSKALCVANRESHFDPNAVNQSSGAAGVFQFMPAVWPSLSSAAGWGGASVFSGEANVAVAAWTVAHYGWSPWQSQSGICGI